MMNGVVIAMIINIIINNLMIKRGSRMRSSFYLKIFTYKFNNDKMVKNIK